MKRLLLILSLLFCTVAFGATETINWYVGGNLYDTTTCESGGDITLPTAPTKYGYTFQGWADYTPIEYLESTGTQWINPNIQMNQNTKFVFDVTASNITNTIIIGVGGTNDDRLASFRAGGSYSYFSVIRNQTTYTPCNMPIDTNRHIFTMDIYNNKVQIDNCLMNIPKEYPSTGSSYNMYIGVYSTLGRPTTGSFAWAGRYYNVKFYDSDTLIRDFIPVLDSAGVPCMYDKVERKFYYNSGTEDFIAGPIIN